MSMNTEYCDACCQPIMPQGWAEAHREGDAIYHKDCCPVCRQYGTKHQICQPTEQAPQNGTVIVLDDNATEALRSIIESLQAFGCSNNVLDGVWKKLVT